LALVFPKPLLFNLKRFCEQVVEGKSVILSEKWGAIDADIQNALHDLVHSNFTGAIQDAFLLSKSIELLVMSVESCGNARQNQPLFIKTKGDKEKIIAARDFINTKITNPPNLSEVSKAVGLNEYKLKRGFKEMFNNTVFGYLTEQRLHLAHRTLLDTEKSAAEIATDFGYGTPQYFNNAFKKKFGETPLAIKKS
jgi:AraC family transcriptional regulator, transcriptional activator of the genes for pyochelin and ferripyochelin receptors